VFSFDECSSNSSDDAAVDESTLDEAQVDAILEAADGDSPPNGADLLPPGRTRALRHANGLRGGFSRENTSDHVLGNGWKKYYIDPMDVARRQQREASRGGGGGGGVPFERGSSQRVTLPLVTGARESATGALLTRRCDQPGLPRHQIGRRSSRDGPADGDAVSTFGARREAVEVGVECRTPTVGFALPVSLAARSQASPLLGSGRSSAGSGSSGAKLSGLLTPSSRCVSDTQRGERLSNYHRATMPRPGGAGHASGNENETESMHEDDELAGKFERSASPTYDCSVTVDTSEDALDRLSSSPDDGQTKFGSDNWTASSSTAIVQDGGQGPAHPSFYPSTSASGFHDYVNVSHLLSSRGAGAGPARPESCASTGSGGSGRSPWVRGVALTGGRMAMSETESVQNIAGAGWPSYGTGPLHRSDSFKSASAAAAASSDGGGGRSETVLSSSLPRYGSMAQMWRDDGAGPCLATFRLGPGHSPLTSGHSPRSSAAAAAPNASSVLAHKSRLSGSKDDNCTSPILSIIQYTSYSLFNSAVRFVCSGLNVREKKTVLNSV